MEFCHSGKMGTLYTQNKQLNHRKTNINTPKKVGSAKYSEAPGST